MSIKTTNTAPQPERIKWEYVFEDEDSISIWRYDIRKTRSGPYEVEYKWKRHFNPWGQKKKTLGDLAKEEKKRKKLEKSQLGIDHPS